MKFDMSRAWSDAVAMVSANREVLLVIAGIFFFLPAVLQGFVLPPLDDVLASGDMAAIQQRMLALYTEYGWLIVLLGLVQMAGTLAMLALLRDSRRPTVDQAIRSGCAGMVPAIGAILLLFLASLPAGLVLMLPTALLLFAGAGPEATGALLTLIMTICVAYVGVRLSLLLAVIAVEQVRNPLTAVRRSWKETRGNVLLLFLFYALLFIAGLVVTQVIGLIVSGLTLVLSESLALIVRSMVAGLIAAVVSTIFTAVVAAIHRQLAGPAGAGAPARP